METIDILSSCSDSKERQMQLMQDKAKESCMVSFRRLHSHLKLLLNNDLKRSRTEDGFRRAFATLFGQHLETFTGTTFLNMDQLEKQLDNKEFQEIGSMAAFKDNSILSNPNSIMKEGLTRMLNNVMTHVIISKPRFASQVDVNNDFSKPVTTHYLPKGKEFAVVKPHHMIPLSSFRYSSNDMVHNQYLKEAKKKTQESGRNSRPSVMPSARLQNIAN
nr:hypothetical protein [Tanacetum cinerariifolium]